MKIRIGWVLGTSFLGAATLYIALQIWRAIATGAWTMPTVTVPVWVLWLVVAVTLFVGFTIGLIGMALAQVAGKESEQERIDALTRDLINARNMYKSEMSFGNHHIDVRG